MRIYKNPPKITWEDAIDKLNYELQLGDDVAVRMLDTYYLSSPYRPNTFQKAYDEVLSNCPLIVDDYTAMDVYISFTGGAESFGKHKDTDDVLIVHYWKNEIYIRQRLHIESWRFFIHT